MPQTSTTEQWAPIPGYEGLYEVSDHGQVRSLPRTITRSDGQQRTYQGKTRAQNANKSTGYMQCNLFREGKGTVLTVHRAVATAFVPGYTDGLEACHNNGDKSDNRAENLRWDTRSNNNLDRQEHGTDYQRNKERCPQGHVLEAPNLIHSQQKLGWRSCLACGRARSYLSKHPDLIDQFPTVADRYYQAITQEVQRA